MEEQRYDVALERPVEKVMTSNQLERAGTPCRQTMPEQIRMIRHFSEQREEEEVTPFLASERPSMVGLRTLCPSWQEQVNPMKMKMSMIATRGAPLPALGKRYQERRLCNEWRTNSIYTVLEKTRLQLFFDKDKFRFSAMF